MALVFLGIVIIIIVLVISAGIADCCLEGEIYEETTV